MRSCDVSQQVLFAQQFGWHAFSLATFVTMHEAAGNRTVAVKSASPAATDTVILLSITRFNSIISAAGRICAPSVDWSLGDSNPTFHSSLPFCDAVDPAFHLCVGKSQGGRSSLSTTKTRQELQLYLPARHGCSWHGNIRLHGVIATFRTPSRRDPKRS